MTTARAALATIAILLAALLAGAYYYYQNLPGLVELMGRERFVERLNEGLAKSSESATRCS